MARAVTMDSQAYAHYGNVASAEGERIGPRVHQSAPLVALYENNGRQPHDNLLRDLTGIAQPAVRCHIQLRDGRSYPPTPSKNEAGYNLYVTYNKLMFAPSVRLECRFVDKAMPTSTPYLVIALDFHFQSRQGRKITSYQARANTMRIDFQGATRSGLTLIPGYQHRFGPLEKAIVEVFRNVSKPSVSGPVKSMLCSLYLDELDPQQLQRLANIRRRLPGGDGPQLVSLSHPEYSAVFQGVDGKLEFELENMPSPHSLMHNKVPFPMTPLGSSITFASITEARVELGLSAHFADLESRLALKMWATPFHRCKLYEVSGFPIIGVTFSRFRQLQGLNDEKNYRLPKELSVKMREQHGPPKIELEGYLEPEAMALPRHNAYFVITSHNLNQAQRLLRLQAGGAQYRYVKFNPHINSFTYTSQIRTVNDLRFARSWHTHLLSQNYDHLRAVDITADLGIHPHKLARAHHWLQNCRPWNAEQLAVINRIFRAQGRMIITMGIAGTGKTLLQCALATFFAMLGFKVLICAPANSNADHSTKILREFASTLQYAGNQRRQIRVHRLYSTSRNYSYQDLSEDQARHHNVGHVRGNVSSIHGLEFRLRSHKDRKAQARNLAIEEGVVEEAMKGELSLHSRLFQDSEPVEIWEIFRRHYEASRNKTFDWKNQHLKDEYDRSYELCKGHLVALTDVIVTTTGNSRCKELDEHFLESQGKYEIPCRGIITFCDEAAKDPEINTWMPIILPGNMTKGVFLFGDEKQLAPTNTCSKGALQFNHYNDRLNLSLPSRLVAAGYDCVHLKEQQRMHPNLSFFPNKEFYGGQLRDGANVHTRLNNDQPGLTRVLHDIVATSSLPPRSRYEYIMTAPEIHARLHYLEIEGKREENENMSFKVTAHVDVFFKHILPDLQKFWGDKTKDNVMIICGYGYAVSEYQHRILRLQQTQQLLRSEYPNRSHHPGATSNGAEANTVPQEDMPLYYPRVVTIDSAQGQESFMVIMDGSFQQRDKMGFINDRGRCNVAMTRARGVFWILGGPLDCENAWNRSKPLSPFAKLKFEMQRFGRVHKVRV